MRKASEYIKSVVDSISGIKSGQIFFTTDGDADPLLFAAWWPWGDGIHISLRIGASDSSLSDGDIKNLLAEWFQLNL